MSIYSNDPYNKRLSLDFLNNLAQRQELNAPQRRQLSGCGSPDCPLCNPEVAEERRRNETAGQPRDYTPPDPNIKSEGRQAVDKYIIPVPEQSFTDIIGNDAALAQLRDAIEAPIKYAELYKAYGMKMPKGALLSGPPGCGKTMFVRAAASEMRRLYGMKEFISVAGSELQSMFVGETEARIKALFAYAREYKHINGHPLLIFIDEAEVLFPDRTGRVRVVTPWEESRVAAFLTEMDGVEECGAFVMLATNRPEVIDSALLRDGRCDFKIVVKRPTQEAVESIVRRSLTASLCADPLDSLVFAAVESFYDPHKILIDFHRMVEQAKGWFESRGYTLDDNGKKQLSALGARNFSLEHIVSGAMAASVASRATRYAFARDKINGVARGITQGDVVSAVNDLFEENKTLEHSFAMQEFLEKLEGELK